MDKFYEIAKLCHQDRIKRHKEETSTPEYNATIEYKLFRIWCRINKKEYNEQSFKEYSKDKPELNFWMKKLIFEMFFDYKFTFDHSTNKWKSEKIK